MSNALMTIPEVEQILTSARSRFVGSLQFEQEFDFAMQAIRKNKYLLSYATDNKESLKDAIINVSHIGLSLNPALSHAHLIPRKVLQVPTVVLDIPYRGLCKLAVDSNCVRFVDAKIVRKNDVFRLRGADQEPIHEYDPFATKEERGEITGAYCLAKTLHGDFLTTPMPIEDIESIMRRSDMYKNKKGPWITDFEEMCKKTVIKRAYKLWPIGDGKFHQAIETINKHEGIDFDREKRGRNINDEELEILKKLCTQVPDGEKRVLAYVTILNGSDIIFQKLSDLTEKDFSKAKDQLNQIINSKKEKTNERTN